MLSNLRRLCISSSVASAITRERSPLGISRLTSSQSSRGKTRETRTVLAILMFYRCPPVKISARAAGKRFASFVFWGYNVVKLTLRGLSWT
jgi:hypothetical protein